MTRFEPKRACEGAATIHEGDMCGCPHPDCGVSIRWDLVDHPFFGFKAGCPLKEKPSVARDSQSIDAVGQPHDVQPDSPARTENCSHCNDLRALYDEAVRQVNAQVNTINDLEAARDHLRARLQQIVADFQARAASHDSPAAELLTPGYAFREAARAVADLLAVLTEPPEEKHNDQSRVDGHS